MFGAKVRPDVVEAIKQNAADAGVPIGQLLEDAVLSFWGSNDPVLKVRRELASSAWKHTKGKTKRPFESAYVPS